jgi:hypothetical protein
MFGENECRLFRSVVISSSFDFCGRLAIDAGAAEDGGHGIATSATLKENKSLNLYFEQFYVN